LVLFYFLFGFLRFLYAFSFPGFVQKIQKNRLFFCLDFRNFVWIIRLRNYGSRWNPNKNPGNTNIKYLKSKQ
jgi:hypothetical protein